MANKEEQGSRALSRRRDGAEENLRTLNLAVSRPSSTWTRAVPFPRYQSLLRLNHSKSRLLTCVNRIKHVFHMARFKLWNLNLISSS